MYFNVKILQAYNIVSVIINIVSLLIRYVTHEQKKII